MRRWPVITARQVRATIPRRLPVLADEARHRVGVEAAGLAVGAAHQDRDVAPCPEPQPQRLARHAQARCHVGQGQAGRSLAYVVW